MRVVNLQTSRSRGSDVPIYVLGHILPWVMGVDLVRPWGDEVDPPSPAPLAPLRRYDAVESDGGGGIDSPLLETMMMANLLGGGNRSRDGLDSSDEFQDSPYSAGSGQGNKLPETNEVHRLMNSIPRQMREFFEEQLQFMRDFPDKFKETLINMAIAHNYGVYLTQLATIINGIEKSSFDMLNVDAEHFRSIKAIICGKISDLTSKETRLCMSILANPRIQASPHSIFQDADKRANLSLFGQLWNSPAAYNTVLQFWNGVKSNSSLKGTNVPIFNTATTTEFQKPVRSAGFQQLEPSLKPGLDLLKTQEVPDFAEQLAAKRFKKHIHQMRYLIYLFYGNASENASGKKDAVGEIREKWWSQVQAESLLQQSRCAVEGLKGLYEGVVKTLNFCMDLEDNLEFGSLCAPAPVLTLWRDSVLTNLGLSFLESGGLGTLKRCEEFTGVSVRGLKDYCKPRAEHPQKNYGAYRAFKLATIFCKLLQGTPSMSRVTNLNMYSGLKKMPGRVSMAWMENVKDAWFRKFEEDSHGQWFRANVVPGFSLRDSLKPIRV